MEMKIYGYNTHVDAQPLLSVGSWEGRIQTGIQCITGSDNDKPLLTENRFLTQSSFDIVWQCQKLFQMIIYTPQDIKKADIVDECASVLREELEGSMYKVIQCMSLRNR
ncbi:Hypothetical protein CINCED_3A016292 [Cinara cedri]|uniref:Uncharacterized protein n=1 Tax=Cinara cedri TaxID=506608 RepID=A0A5E4MNJ8_9HEMI|nr:Hypothetical protein CINCED_3A016292 [Cinara cedri]